MQVSDPKVYFTGLWDLTRVLQDTGRRQTGTFDGEARFAPDDDDLIYRETGRLVFGCYDDRTSRAYIYRFPTFSSSTAEVLFADGKPFHRLDLTTGEASVRHICGKDVYDGQFCAISADRWTADWSAIGPRKNLVIRSHYQRVP